MQTVDLFVVGGGPAGFTAAIFAARRGLKVVIADKNKKKTLSKLRITGKGRCNLTNNCTHEEFFDNCVRGSRFLRSSISGFGPSEIMNFFEELGIPLKTERGRRVYPLSDKAEDIAAALEKEAGRLGVIVLKDRVTELIVKEEKIKGVRLQSGDAYVCPQVLLATGGLSYPLTGSDGDGYRLAALAGHHCTDTYPSLVALTCSDGFIPELEGLSLRNVELVCRKDKKTIFKEQGEMLFTSNGISGPLVLTLSALLAGKEHRDYRLYLDLKPALDEDTLDKRILRDFAENSNRDFRNSLGALLPASLIPVIVELSKTDPSKKVNSVTSAERGRLLSLIKHFPLTLTGSCGYSEAVVTAGGIVTSEINPSTMMSKKVEGLYFAGEILDCDAYTGGYNLTIAFSTGYTVGISAEKETT